MLVFVTYGCKKYSVVIFYDANLPKCSYVQNQEEQELQTVRETGFDVRKLYIVKRESRRSFLRQK